MKLDLNLYVSLAQLEDAWKRLTNNDVDRTCIGKDKVKKKILNMSTALTIATPLVEQEQVMLQLWNFIGIHKGNIKDLNVELKK